MKNNSNSWILPKLVTFRENYHVLGFSSSFQQNIAESMGTCENASKLVDFTKTSNFLSNYHVLGFESSFQHKSCKKHQSL